MLARLARNLVPIFHRRAWKRLRSSIAAYRAEIEARAVGGTGSSANSTHGQWALSPADLDKIGQVLDRADRLVAAGDIDGGWKCFLAAQRLALLACPADELAAAAKSMQAEADKLDSWRRTAVLDLLKEDRKEAVLNFHSAYANTKDVLNASEDRANRGSSARHSTGPEQPHLVRILHATLPFDERRHDQTFRARVVQAAYLRDEHYHNEAYRNGLRRSSILCIVVALTIGLALLFLLAWCGALPQILRRSLPQDAKELAGALLTVAVFGFLGAIFSAATSIAALHASKRIPELAGSIRVMLLRLFVGPVSAVVVYLAAYSQLYHKFFSFPSPDGPTLLVIAFAAGFTERLVSRVVNTIAGK